MGNARSSEVKSDGEEESVRERRIETCRETAGDDVKDMRDEAGAAKSEKSAGEAAQEKQKQRVVHVKKSNGEVQSRGSLKMSALLRAVTEDMSVALHDGGRARSVLSAASAVAGEGEVVTRMEMDVMTVADVERVVGDGARGLKRTSGTMAVVCGSLEQMHACVNAVEQRGGANRHTDVSVFVMMKLKELCLACEYVAPLLAAIVVTADANGDGDAEVFTYGRNAAVASSSASQFSSEKNTIAEFRAKEMRTEDVGTLLRKTLLYTLRARAKSNATTISSSSSLSSSASAAAGAAGAVAPGNGKSATSAAAATVNDIVEEYSLGDDDVNRALRCVLAACSASLVGGNDAVVGSAILSSLCGTTTNDSGDGGDDDNDARAAAEVEEVLMLLLTSSGILESGKSGSGRLSRRPSSSMSDADTGPPPPPPPSSSAAATLAHRRGDGTSTSTSTSSSIVDSLTAFTSSFGWAFTSSSSSAATTGATILPSASSASPLRRRRSSAARAAATAELAINSIRALLIISDRCLQSGNTTRATAAVVRVLQSFELKEFDVLYTSLVARLCDEALCREALLLTLMCLHYNRPFKEYCSHAEAGAGLQMTSRVLVLLMRGIDDDADGGAWALGGVPHATLLLLLTMSESRNYCTAIAAMTAGGLKHSNRAATTAASALSTEMRRRIATIGVNGSQRSGNHAAPTKMMISSTVEDAELSYADMMIRILSRSCMRGMPSYPYAPLCLSALINLGAFVREMLDTTATDMFTLVDVLSEPNMLFTSAAAPERLRDAVQAVLTTLQHLRAKKVALRAQLMTRASRLRELRDIEGTFIIWTEMTGGGTCASVTTAAPGLGDGPYTSNHERGMTMDASASGAAAAAAEDAKLQSSNASASKSSDSGGLFGTFSCWAAVFQQGSIPPPAVTLPSANAGAPRDAESGTAEGSVGMAENASPGDGGIGGPPVDGPLVWTGHGEFRATIQWARRIQVRLTPIVDMLIAAVDELEAAMRALDSSSDGGASSKTSSSSSYSGVVTPAMVKAAAECELLQSLPKQSTIKIRKYDLERCMAAWRTPFLGAVVATEGTGPL